MCATERPSDHPSPPRRRVKVTPIPCLLPTSRIRRDGYASIIVRRKWRQAHRVAWERANGMPVPDGLQVGHLCHDLAAAAGECQGGNGCLHRRCVEPTHLTLTTARTNALGSPFTLAGRNARKSHCIRGHPLSGDNLFQRGDSGRQCRECLRFRGRRKYHARRAAQGVTP